MSDEKRFSYRATITIKDRLGEDTFLCSISSKSDDKKEIVKTIESQVKEIWLKVSKHFSDELTAQEIQDKIKYFKDEKRWGNRRISNWFSKFGIEVDLPRKRLKNGQQSLCGGD